MSLLFTKFNGMVVPQAGAPDYVTVIPEEAKEVCDAMACLSALLSVHLPYSAQEKVDYALGVIDAFSRGEMSYTTAMEAMDIITGDGEIVSLCGYQLEQHMVQMAV